jgi:hypothetical protein
VVPSPHVTTFLEDGNKPHQDRNAAAADRATHDPGTRFVALLARRNQEPGNLEIQLAWGLYFDHE